MKRQEDFKQVKSSKKAKQTSTEASSSQESEETNAPTGVNEEKVQQTKTTQTNKGKATPSNTTQKFVPMNKGKAIAPTGIQRPYISAVVKDWYNLDMKASNPNLYDNFNGCFKAIQSANHRAVNFWLTQLEKPYLGLRCNDPEILISKIPNS